MAIVSVAAVAVATKFSSDFHTGMVALAKGNAARGVGVGIGVGDILRIYKSITSKFMTTL